MTADSWAIFILVLVLLAIAAFGCAAAEPSSTDNHHRLPEINCTEAKLDGQYHHLCCEGPTCWPTN